MKDLTKKTFDELMHKYGEVIMIGEIGYSSGTRCRIIMRKKK